MRLSFLELANEEKAESLLSSKAEGESSGWDSAAVEMDAGRDFAAILARMLVRFLIGAWVGS